MLNWKINIAAAFVFALSVSTVAAQVNIKDSELLQASFQKNETNTRQVQSIKKSKFNPLALPMIGAMWVYQKAISPQISADCLYYPSCSNFSKQCIEQHGWLRGLALTADRLSRCSRLSAIEIPPTAERKNGRVIDLPESYK